MFYGTQMANGKIAMAGGAVLAMAGLFMLAYPAARRWCAVVLACAVVVAAAEVGWWWLNNLPVAVGSVGAMEACGVLLGLAAVPLCLPGPVRKRASLLAATVLLCVIGMALVRPGSAADFVVY